MAKKVTSRAGAAKKKTGTPGVSAPYPSPYPRHPRHPDHRGAPVRVGPYTVLSGATFDLVPSDLERADVLVPLAGSVPFAFGRRYEVIGATMQDYGGVPDGWREFLEGVILPELRAGRCLLAFCVGGHGRTGTFLASLIALLESREETPDPILAVRKRHCERAVESRAQAEAIFALRGEALPAQYEREFSSLSPDPFVRGLGGEVGTREWPVR